MEALSRDLIAMQQSKTKQEVVTKAKEIISEGQLPWLLQEISDIANKFEVKITQIKPSQDVKSQEEIIAPVKLFPLFITLDLSCGYHSLGSFINELENANRFIAIKDMRISRSSSDYLHQSITLVLKTYVKK
jgi:Tfp pilus assembly protein PilO